MKKIFLAIFIIIVVIITSLGVYYVSSPAKSQELQYETVKNSIKVEKAFVVRQEEVYYADASGTLYNNIDNGDRVASNSLLTTIYHADVSSDVLKTLKTVDKKIEKEQDKNNKISSYSIDFSDAESTVAAIVREISNTSNHDNISEIAEYKDIINSIRSGEELQKEDVLQKLYDEKAAMEESINSSKSEIRTNIAGVFTTYIDGLESFLVSENIKDYTPSYLESLPAPKTEKLTGVSVNTNAPICKVQNNHVWYLALSLPTQNLPECSVGTSVSLKLDSVSNEEIDGEIYFISEDENGKTLIAIKCANYVEGAFSQRESSTELIFKSHSGFKVPIYAIRTDENNKKYVLCRSGAKEYKCYCTVDYTNPEEEYIIINTAVGAEHRLEEMDQIIIGEK